MARFDTGHGNLEDVRGDWPAVEQWFLRLHYRCLPHIHLLFTDGVQYGARGFVGLQRKVCNMRHLKGNENGRLYIYIKGGWCDRHREGVELSQRRSTAEHVQDRGRAAMSSCGSRCSSRCWCNTIELLPKKSARGKSAAFFSGFCLLQLKTAGTKVVDISTSHLFCGSYRCCDCLR